MRRFLLWLTLLGGVLAIAFALLMPAHLRATDPHVIRQLGAESTSLVQIATETASQNPPVAKIFLATAESLELAGTDQVLEELRNFAPSQPRGRTILEQLEVQESGRIQVGETPVFNALRKAANRERVLNSLHSLEAKQVLRNRAMTNLVIFAPVKSAAGQPLDIAILTTAFLLEHRAFSSTLPLREQVLRMAAQVDPALEEFYLSVFSLAKRFSSEQLIALVANVPTVDALNSITRYIQEDTDSAPLIYSCVIVSKKGGAVASYINNFSKTVKQDLSFALSTGRGGLERLLQDQQPIYRSRVFDGVTGTGPVRAVMSPFVGLSVRVPALSILLKFLFIALGAFLLATAMRFRKPDVADEPYVFYPQFSVIRRAAFAAVFVMLAVILGEPYIAQGEQEAPPPMRISFPLLGAATAAAPTTIQSSTTMLDPHTILAIVTFLVLQISIYVICLVKLKEIKKQPVSNAIKLKLLDNEDNLFDGGLYAGLFGTAASLIMLTLGVIKPSLISAYSATLFGILFVAILKIGHVRPLKRRLLLDPSNDAEVATAPAVASTTSAPPVRNPFSS